MGIFQCITIYYIVLQCRYLPHIQVIIWIYQDIPINQIKIIISKNQKQIFSSVYQPLIIQKIVA